MSFISVKEASEKWGITERVVRQYCADGRVPGAFITGKTWNIPDNAEKPGRKPRQRLVPEGWLGGCSGYRQLDPEPSGWN